MRTRQMLLTTLALIALIMAGCVEVEGANDSNTTQGDSNTTQGDSNETQSFLTIHVAGMNLSETFSITIDEGTSSVEVNGNGDFLYPVAPASSSEIKIEMLKNPVRNFCYISKKDVLIEGNITVNVICGTPHSIDHTFGNYGSFAHIEEETWTHGNGVAVTDGGSILIAGTIAPWSSFPDMALWKIGEGGEKDALFAHEGIATEGVPTYEDNGKSVDIDSSGNIYVAGATHNENSLAGNTYLTVWKYKPNGLLDPTFGTDGGFVWKAIDSSRGMAINVEDDGSILVLGDGFLGEGFTILGMKLDKNGSIDTTFGSSGFIEAIPGATWEWSADFKEDGKFIVGTGSRIFQFTHNGVYDVSFGDRGVVELMSTLGNHEDGKADKIYTVKYAENGEIYAAGLSYKEKVEGENAPVHYPIIIKLQQSGSKDSGFGVDHGATHRNDPGKVTSLALDPEGSVYVNIKPTPKPEGGEDLINPECPHITGIIAFPSSGDLSQKRIYNISGDAIRFDNHGRLLVLNHPDKVLTVTRVNP